MEVLPSGDGILRLTTYNILAPVWVHHSVYPGQEASLFDAESRRAILAKRLLELAPDVVYLQEVQKTELDALMAEVGGEYEHSFCPFPLTFWTNWLTDTTNHEPRENGVCILTRRGVVAPSKPTCVPIDLPEWSKTLPAYALGAHALFVTATLPGNRAALLVASHLDADSSQRAGLQLTRLAAMVKQAARDEGVAVVLWGGDFNLPTSNSTFRALTATMGGFRLLSSEERLPTVYATSCTVRVDHILVHEPTQHAAASVHVLPLATYVPRCPHGHTFAVLPFQRELQAALCLLVGERGRMRQLGFSCALLVGWPLALALVLPFAYLVTCEKGALLRRQAWALTEWGSDHLPVTVAMRLTSAAGGNDAVRA